MEAKQQGYKWADDAIENAANADFNVLVRRREVLESSLSDALGGSFNWALSPQGSKYWANIYDDLIDQGK